MATFGVFFWQEKSLLLLTFCLFLPEMTMGENAGHHISYLDGWRGLAIVTLLIGHFFPVPGISLGAVGVNLFFVLSGLLMARILYVDAIPLQVFYRRRISRIMPAVYFFLCAVVAAHAMGGAEINWRETAAAAVFMKNYFPGAPGGGDMPFGHVWSLSVEEHSYVVLSVLALLARKSWGTPRALLGVLMLASAGAGLWYWVTYTGSRFSFDRGMRTEVSAFGILASAFFLLLFHGRKLPRVPSAVFFALIVLGMAMHWWSIPAPVSTLAGVGAFALAINVLHMAPQSIHTALAWKPLRQLGLWSFSIYLWQQPFYLQVRHHGMDPLIGAGLALAAGVLSFYLVERPMRNYLNGGRWRNRHSDVMAVKPVQNEIANEAGVRNEPEAGDAARAVTRTRKPAKLTPM